MHAELVVIACASIDPQLRCCAVLGSNLEPRRRILCFIVSDELRHLQTEVINSVKAVHGCLVVRRSVWDQIAPPPFLGESRAVCRSRAIHDFETLVTGRIVSQLLIEWASIKKKAPRANFWYTFFVSTKKLYKAVGHHENNGHPLDENKSNS